MRRSGLNDPLTLWLLTARETKNKRTHVVPLAPAAAAIITRAPRFTGDRVFENIGGWSWRKEALGDGVPGWTLHDLRRNAAAGLARLSHAPHVVERGRNKDRAREGTRMNS